MSRPVVEGSVSQSDPGGDAADDLATGPTQDLNADSNGESGAEPDSELTGDFSAIRPRGDAIGRAQIHARLNQLLFDEPPEPVKVGRFVILDRLGAGGMGVVYEAYDPHLDRRVALKLVQASRDDRDAAHRRLRREALSLARLSHPNVVPVHEVGVLDDQVFIVMEFVVGRTLGDWIAQEDRSWREILAVYIQAARGLAAAHAGDLVHRDFKPANAIIGEDHRVRVLDFGLARSRQRGLDGPAGRDSDAELDSEPDADAELDADADTDAVADSDRYKLAVAELNGITPAEIPILTATNAVVGTPAYMAPEQLAGREVGPASDQFSFCVALYEALYDQRPYRGRSLIALGKAFDRGQIAAPPANSRVPGWLYPILCRGLQTEPEKRYPSMDALLAALQDDPVRKRRRRLAAMAVVAALATTTGLAIYALARPVGDPPCAGVGQEIGQLWNPETRAELERVLRDTGRAYADEAWPRVAAGLDRYTADWVAMRRDACESHQSGVQSGDMLDRRMACLDGVQTAVESALTVLAETDANGLTRAVDVVQELPPVAYCGDTAALAAQVPPPRDPAVARQVDDLRARLSLAEAHEHAGRYSDALAIAEPVLDRAETLDYEPVLAEALLATGRITMMHRGASHAVELLHRATAVGVAAGVDDVALEALARRVWADSVRPGSTDEQTAVMRDVLVPLGESLARRTPQSGFKGGFGHALLLNNTGVTYMAREDRARARDYFERALALQREKAVSALELAAIPLNLALITPDEDHRVAVLEDLLTRRETALGASHLSTLDVRTNLAYAVSDPQRARKILEPAHAALRLHHPNRLVKRAKYTLYLSFLASDAGDRQSALEWLDELAAMPDLPGDSSPATRRTYDLYRESARGYAALDRGDPKSAAEAFTVMIGQFSGDEQRWWVKKNLAIAELGLGLAEIAQGRHRDAGVALERARASFQRATEINENTDHQRWLAKTRVALATALWHSAAGPSRHAQRTRAETLISRARAWYRGAGPGYRHRAQELESWPKQQR